MAPGWHRILSLCRQFGEWSGVMIEFKRIIDSNRWSHARGEDSHFHGTGMLVVSLRGVNFRFWSHLGCTWQNVIIFSDQGLI